MKKFHPLMGPLPPNQDLGRTMASCTLRTHLKGRLSINLVVPVVIEYCSSMVKIFSSVKRMFSCPFSACHWRRRFALVRRISLKAGLRCRPFQRRCALMCRSSLMRHDFDWVDMFSFRDLIFFFQNGFRRIRSRSVLIAASALTLFRRSERALLSTLQSSL